MIFGIKRLIFSGLIGVLVACLITAGFRVEPWSDLLREASNDELLSAYCPRPPSGISLSEPKVNIAVSEFTEPPGIGSEAEIRVTVTSRYDVYYVTVRIDLLDIPSYLYPNATSCIKFVDGNKSRIWLVNLQANVSTIFTESIKAIDVGFGAIRASAAWWGIYGDDDHLGQDSLLVSVSEEEIVVTRKPLPNWHLCPESSEYNIILLRGFEFNVTPTVISLLDIKNITEFIVEPPISEYHPSSEPFEIPMYSLIPRAPLPPRPRLAVSLQISEFEPSGLGGEADLTVTITSNYDASDVTALIDLAGLELVIGHLTWSGELQANVPKSFSVAVRASRVGYWDVEAFALWYMSPIQFYDGSCKLGIHVSRDEISTVKDGFSEDYRVMIPRSSVYLEPAIINWTTDSHKINETLTFEVRVTNVVDLFAIQFYIKWDPNVLRFLSVEKGDFLETLEYPSIWFKSEREIDLG